MNADGLSVRATKSGVRMELRVIPRAPKNQIAGVRDGRLLVRVTAPPVDSAANDAVIVLLAHALGRPRRDIHIVVGESSRNKTVEIGGIHAADLDRLLAAARPR